MYTRFTATALIFTLSSLLLIGPALAHSPSPEAKAKFIADGTWPKIVANLKAFDAAQDPDMYERSRMAHLDRHRSAMALGTDGVDTVRVVVLLVDFPDFHYDADSLLIPGGGTLRCNVAGTPPMFDSLLFSQRGIDAVSNPSGSMTEWYLENSYGNYFVQGDVFGWYRAPNNYSYYVGNDNGLSGGAVLASDAILAADLAGVDFSPYGDAVNSVPAVIIIHAGPGAEQGAYGIWSHRSNMSPGVSADGVHMSGYTMQPEERFNQASLVHVGVFCHEWGHVLGVPDWYDTQYNPGSEGLGNWAVMAGGSWNNGGRTPAHFTCWSKYLAGFGEMQWLTENYTNAPIPQVATSPIAYALREIPEDQMGGDFWFVENRQKVGFDEYIPGNGLLIYHFDPMGNQTNPDRYRLAVEQADGRNDLATVGGNSGDNGDPFPGRTGNHEFHAFTVPDSRTNDGEITEVSVLNISGSSGLMHADLNVFYAMPYLLLVGDSLAITDDAPGGNGDGLFEQGETLEIYLEVENIMRNAYYPTLYLDIDNSDVEILQNDQSMGNSLNPVMFSVTNEAPIIVRIPDDFMSSITKFTFTITSDSTLSGGHDRSFTNTFEFDITLGRTQILLVDDDEGFSNDYNYRQALDRLGLPFERWDKLVSGSPDYASVSQYPIVFWMSGDYWPPSIVRGTLTSDDVAFMTELLDNGGNLLLASPSAPFQLHNLDSAFMADYLHANLTGSWGFGYNYFLGDENHTLGGGLLYTTKNGLVWDEITPTLAPANGGEPAFTLTYYGSGDYGYCGITYDGTYRTAFLSFAVEFLTDTRMNDGYAPPDSLILNALRFFARGSATAVEDNAGDNLLPTSFALDQNYPNPFNPSTTLSYSIEAGQVGQTNLSIFNVLGQKVATLVDEVQGPGYYTVEWSGRRADGNLVASGIYFYRLTHGDRTDTKKMMLLK